MKSFSWLPKAVAAAGLLLLLALIRWACLARITHDEGYMLGTIDNFAFEHVMRHVYNGRWGSTWVVTTGPTVSLPIALAGMLVGSEIDVVFSRLFVLALVAACFVGAGRMAGSTFKRTLTAAAFFLLWVGCMPWRPAINGSSFNLIANVFGEGSGFGFALLANLLAARRSARHDERSWFWVCALLAVGSKAVAALAVVAPASWIVFDAVRSRSSARIGWRGLAGAVAILGAWQAWQAQVLGLAQYYGEWQGFFYWLKRGGGYVDGFAPTIGAKLEQLAASYVDPFTLGALCLGALFILWRSRDSLPNGWRMTAASAGVFFGWWLFFSARGWMRHLWIGYALLGWMLAATLASALEKERERQITAIAVLVFLAAIGLRQGSLKALGPIEESARWSTQKRLADELQEQYPEARLFVMDWHFVPQVAFFQRKPQNNLQEVDIRVGDLVLCDLESSDCGLKLFGRYCVPKPTTALIGYCVYGHPK